MKTSFAVGALSALVLSASGTPSRGAQVAADQLITQPSAAAPPLAASTPPRDDGKIHPGPALEAASAATARDLPGVALQIGLPKTRFMVGEEIRVTLIYRNDGERPIGFTRTSTGFRPSSMVHREFRARQLDGDALLESQSWKYGPISGSIGIGEIKPREDAREVVFLNERFFFSRPGQYELTAWSNAVASQGADGLSSKSRWLQSAPLTLQILPATEAFKTQTLSDAQKAINAALTVAKGRALSSSPPELEGVRQVGQRLVWLQDERAIPLLLSALEIGNNTASSFEYALEEYPRAQIMAALKARPDGYAPVTIRVAEWLNKGDNSPAERAALLEQRDKTWRTYLQGATTPQQRGGIALSALENSPTLRQDAQFWHEALANLGVGSQNSGTELYSLLSQPEDEAKTRAGEYPIQTADLKAALEAKAPFQVRMALLHALEQRDPAYLRAFLLGRVVDVTFDYPRGAFAVFDDAQIKDVATVLIACIQSPEWEGDPAWRDEFGRRLRDLALRGATSEQLEQTESWLLNHTPQFDAPILDAIQMKVPARAWFWLQQSLAQRPLETPYDNRMGALVLQRDPAARKLVRGLLKTGTDARRAEILNAIRNAVAEPVVAESRARWFSGDQLVPRAPAVTFADLSTDITTLATSATTSAEVKRAARQATEALAAARSASTLAP